MNVHANMAVLPLQTIDSDAFRSLSPHATRLLLLFVYEFNGVNNGSLCVSWERAREFGFTNKGVFYRALRELEQKGFIALTKPAVRRGKPSAARWAITWGPA